MLFEDRRDAGRKLALLLRAYRDENPIVLGLPRGGVPVAYEVAEALEAQLDVIVARKLGAPGFPEYGIGAIAEGGAVYVSRGAVRELGLEEAAIAVIAEREGAELQRRVRRYRGERELPDLSRRTVILVDDGIATGGTMRAAVKAVRERKPARLVVAAPVVAFQTAAALLPEVDDLVYVEAPEDFIAVGVWYKRFGQTSDDEVVACLEKARRAELGLAERSEPADPWEGDWIEGKGGDEPPAEAPGVEREVAIPVGRLFLSGYLAVPAGAEAIVVFAHGSGSSRRSPRNQYVAGVLRESRLATLLMDLLTPEEAGGTGGEGARFDVDLLARRLVAATRWLASQAETARLVAGYFGASTGAAAALVAAAAAPDQVRAVVSRGGRPDLAGEGALSMVRAPTLLVVGGRDEPVIATNRAALAHIRVEKQLVVVPGASHLFEEPGTLQAVAHLAAAWFGRFLRVSREAEART